MTLLMLLFFCHFLADYTPLSTARMLAAKKVGRPFAPILAHGFTHGVLMCLVLFTFGVKPILAVILALAQGLLHTGIDTLKGRLQVRYTQLQSPDNSLYWVVFGIDQYLHAVVIILMWHYAGK